VFSPVVASIEHFSAFGGFLAKGGKTAFEVQSVATMRMTNQKKYFVFPGRTGFQKAARHKCRTSCGSVLQKNILFCSTYNVAGARCQLNLFQEHCRWDALMKKGTGC